MSAITSEESSLSSDDNLQSKAICGECGKELDNKWTCSTCRRECSICQRALSNDLAEYCERCYRLCQYHGLHRKTIQCPECVQ